MPTPRLSASASASIATTPTPARANTSAIPAPMVPRPATATSPISMAATLLSRASPAGAPPAGPLELPLGGLVMARCIVDYAGRLSAHLPLATRLLIVKADSSVLVHSDGGSYKPLNWMSPPCRLAESATEWVVTGKSGETLTIAIEELISDSSFDLGIDPGLVKDAVESHLQELLAAQLELLGAGWRLVRRYV